MAYNSNINPGNPPLVWSRIRDAFDKINDNFTIIGTTLATERQKNIAHVETGTPDSNPVTVTAAELHSLEDQQEIFIEETGISQIDRKGFYVKVIDDTTFELYTDQNLTTAVDGTSFDAYSSGGGVFRAFSEYSSTDFENLTSNVSPSRTDEFNLGSSTAAWQRLYISEYSDTPGMELNGVWLGTAQIKGSSGVIDLPLGSTVNGELIINPEQTFFKSVQIDNGDRIVADDFVDTLNLLSGSGVSMSADSGAESITLENTGVLSNVAGSGIGVSSATGNVTLTNTGVRSIQSVTALPSGRTEGAGININNATGDNLKVTNTGVIEIQAGSAALTVFTDDATGIVTITNAAPAGNAYRTIDVGGDGTTLVSATTVGGTLKVVEGNGITLTGDDSLQELNIAFSGQSDITGSVFAEDSTLLVDAVDSKIVGEVDNALTITSQLNATNITSDGVIDFTNATINFANTQWQNIPDPINMDIVGSVFADDSTLLVNGVDGTIPAENLSGIATVDLVGNVTGNLTGYQTGDMTGSVFADDSTKLVDGAEGKIVGPVESDDIRGSFIGTVFADDSSVVINEEGTVLGTIAPGAAAPASETEAAPVGEIRVDDNYVYVRKSTGWGKIAIGGWV